MDTRQCGDPARVGKLDLRSAQRNLYRNLAEWICRYTQVIRRWRATQRHQLYRRQGLGQANLQRSQDFGASGHHQPQCGSEKWLRRVDSYRSGRVWPAGPGPHGSQWRSPAHRSPRQAPPKGLGVESGQSRCIWRTARGGTARVRLLRLDFLCH